MSSSSSPAVDTSAYYRLTNNWLGYSQALDVVEDGTKSGKLTMAATGNTSGQHWHFAQLEHPGEGLRYALRSQHRGEGFSLDVRNDAGVNSRTVELAVTGLFSGQYWTVTPWGDGSFRLTNDFTGPERHLDTYSGSEELHMGDGNRYGQHWHFERIGTYQGN